MPVIVNVYFFGNIADVTGHKNAHYSCSDTVELKKQLYAQFPQLEKSTFVLAVNKKIIKETQSLNEQDSVALLPPFSGG